MDSAVHIQNKIYCSLVEMSRQSTGRLGKQKLA